METKNLSENIDLARPSLGHAEVVPHGEGPSGKADGSMYTDMVEQGRGGIQDLRLIIVQKQTMGLSVQQEESRLRQLEREQGIREANDATRPPLSAIPRRTDEVLQSKGIEVFSDEPLREEDVAFIAQVKDRLDQSTFREVRIIIANPAHWQSLFQAMGQDERHRTFNGRASENPIVPADVKPFIVLPTAEAFTADTDYKKMHMSSPAAKQLLEDATSRQDYYRGIYLRNLLAHELAHLYQFGQQEKERIRTAAGNVQEFHQRYNAFLPLREFLSCAYGLFQLKKYNPAYAQTMVDACQNVLRLELGDAYRREQCQRTIDAGRMLEKMTEPEAEEYFQQAHLICQSDGGDEKQNFQYKMESGGKNTPLPDPGTEKRA